MANNKRRCLACLPTMKSVAWRGAFGCPTTARFLDDTRRIAGARAPNSGPAPPPQPQRHVLRSIGRPSGRKTHQRVRLAHASGERNRFGAPHRHGGVQTYSFLFHEVLLLTGPFLSPPPPVPPSLFPFMPIRNA